MGNFNSQNGEGTGITFFKTLTAVTTDPASLHPQNVEPRGLLTKSDGTVGVKLRDMEATELIPQIAGVKEHYNIKEIDDSGSVPITDIVLWW